jgi:hypothetical protein
MKTKWGRKMMWQVVVVVAVGILWPWGMVWSDDALAATDACKLLSAAELEAVFGGKVIYNQRLSAAEMGAILGGNVTDAPRIGENNKEVCQMSVGTSFVMVRRVAEKDVDTTTGSKGIEVAKKMGLKVKEEKYGNATCWTVVGNSQTAAYTTGCIVYKGGFLVGVDVVAPSEAQLVPSAKVGALVEKAASRL